MKMTMEQLAQKGYTNLGDGTWGKMTKVDIEHGCEYDIVKPTTKPLKRIRQSTKPLMNKLEQEWLDELNKRYPNRWFLPQAVKFRLGNGIVYTPDIFNFDDFHKPTAWEVKGPHAHRGGFENLKVAASLYPKIRWILVWKENGSWKEQHILP